MLICSYVRIMFFDFSSAFNTIRPPILKDRLLGMGVAPSLTSLIIDYLTARPQYVRMGRCVSGMLECSTGVPQGTVLASFHPVHISLQVQSCHIQKQWRAQTFWRAEAERKKRAHIARPHHPSQGGTLARVLAPERTLEGSLAHILAPKRAL